MVNTLNYIERVLQIARQGIGYIARLDCLEFRSQSQGARGSVVLSSATAAVVRLHKLNMLPNEGKGKEGG